MKFSQILLPILLLGALNAQVTVDDTGSAIGSGTFTNTDLGDGMVDFDPTGSDKIVVAFVDETGSPTAISYAGTPLIQAIFRENTQRSDIWYADFPSGATPGDLVVSGGTDPFGISIWALSNTADGFVAKASAGAISIDFDPRYDGSAVIAAVANNGDGDAIAQDPLTPLQNATSLVGGARGGSGWVVTNAGLNTFPFNVPGPSRPTLTIVSFAAIGADTDPPAISSISPADGSTNLLTDVVFTLRFDEAIFPGTGSILLKEDGGATVGTYDVTSAPQLNFGIDTLTITPDVLDPDTSYFFQMPSGTIVDGSGNTTAYADTTLDFSTGPFKTWGGRADASYTISELRNFDPTGYDQLVVMTMDEGSSFPSDVQWGTTPFSQVPATANNSNRRTTMWYLDGPFSGPDSLTISGIGSSFGVSLVALSGTSSGVGSNTNTNATSINFETLTADSFVVTGLTMNGGGNPATGSAPLTTYFSKDTVSSDGACGIYQSSAAGTSTYSFTGNTSSPALVIAEFPKASAPSSPYDTWADGTFANGTLTDKTPTGDDDGDSLSNLLEFAFGTDPTDPSDASALIWSDPGFTAGTPTVQHDFPGGGGVEFTARFVRRTDAGDPGSASYAWRFSSDLTDWESSDGPPGWSTTETILATDGDYELVEVPYPLFLDNNKKARFFQVEVNEEP